MNKSTLRTLGYTALGVIVFLVIARLFFAILPYLLIGGGVIYLVTKILGYFNSKKKSSENTYSSTYTNNDYESYTDDTVDPSKAIDVDYEDVDK